jgi:CheY-like chemotaxis protein
MGFRASFVENGAQAMNAFDKDRYDAIVTDFNLPDMSGIDILKAAREKRAAKIAVMVSGSPTFDVAVQAMQLGAMDFEKGGGTNPPTDTSDEAFTLHTLDDSTQDLMSAPRGCEGLRPPTCMVSPLLGSNRRHNPK